MITQLIHVWKAGEEFVSTYEEMTPQRNDPTQGLWVAITFQHVGMLLGAMLSLNIDEDDGNAASRLMVKYYVKTNQNCPG